MNENASLREPYRVAIWGPGLVGSTALKEILSLPEFEMVGVFAYSESKVGVDVGELVGVDPIGIITTNNRDVFLSLPAELVIYTAADMGDFSSDADIIDLLRSGKNVLTTLPYHYPKVRGQEIVDKLESACLEGGVTLYATGLYPGYFPESLATALTIPVSGLTHLKIAEMVDACGVASPLLLKAFGFGEPLNPDDTSSPAYQTPANYYPPVVQMLADQMGVELDSIESICNSRITEQDLQLRIGVIKKGTLGSVAYDWVGMVNGKPFITFSINWYMTDAMRPEEAHSPECWVLTAEGNPSFQCKVDIKHSFEDDIPIDKDKLNFAGSGILIVKSIAAAIEAPPGIKTYSLGERVWRRDMRLK